MSKYLNTTTRLPDEAETVPERLADLMENAEVVVDGYHLSDHDRAIVVQALRDSVIK